MRSVEAIVSEQHERRMSRAPVEITMPRVGTPLKLTPRLRAQALKLLGEGLTQAETGKRLGLSQSTVARAVKP